MIKKTYYILSNGSREISVYIITADSFAYNILPPCSIKEVNKAGTHDYFKKLVSSIPDKLIKENIQFISGTDVNLRNALIILDECQDLPCEYYMAFKHVVNKLNSNFYMIGDFLQSINAPDNIAKYLLMYNQDETTKLIDGKNLVRRFHNPNLAVVVNHIVDFKKYNLPKIESGCTNKECGFDHTPYPIILLEPSFIEPPPDFKEFEKYQSEKIILEIKKLLAEKFYKPEDFLFIMPVIKCDFSAILDAELQHFWIDLIERDNKYRKWLYEQEYWGEFLLENIKEYKFRLSYRHMSNDGVSIDLSISEHASRIVSIHASKGDGRKVVFLVRFDSDEISRHPNAEIDSLKYDSMVHVGLTRAKERLYVAPCSRRCPIYRKLYCCEVAESRITSGLKNEYLHIPIIKSNIYYNRLLSDFEFLNILNIFNEPSFIKIKDKLENHSSDSTIDMNDRIMVNRAGRFMFRTKLISKIRYNDKSFDKIENSYKCWYARILEISKIKKVEIIKETGNFTLCKLLSIRDRIVRKKNGEQIKISDNDKDFINHFNLDINDMCDTVYLPFFNTNHTGHDQRILILKSIIEHMITKINDNTSKYGGINYKFEETMCILEWMIFDYLIEYVSYYPSPAYLWKSYIKDIIEVFAKCRGSRMIHQNLQSRRCICKKLLGLESVEENKYSQFISLLRNVNFNTKYLLGSIKNDKMYLKCQKDSKINDFRILGNIKSGLNLISPRVEMLNINDKFITATHIISYFNTLNLPDIYLKYLIYFYFLFRSRNFNLDDPRKVILVVVHLESKKPYKIDYTGMLVKWAPILDCLCDELVGKILASKKIMLQVRDQYTRLLSNGKELEFKIWKKIESIINRLKDLGIVEDSSIPDIRDAWKKIN